MKNTNEGGGLDVLQMTSMTCAGMQHEPYKASDPQSSVCRLDGVLQTHNCKVIELQHPMVIVSRRFTTVLGV